MQATVRVAQLKISLRRIPTAFHPIAQRGKRHDNAYCFVAAVIAAALATQSSARALTMTECSAKYKDAKAAARSTARTGTIFEKVSAIRARRAVRQKHRRPARVRSSSPRMRCFRPRWMQNIRAKSRAGRGQNLPRSVQGQQSDQCQWRLEMAAEGRRLLQPVRQEAQRRGVIRHCEERQRRSNPVLRLLLDCFASLAMTMVGPFD